MENKKQPIVRDNVPNSTVQGYAMKTMLLEHDMRTSRIKLNTKGTIKLSVFAITQLIMGIPAMAELTKFIVDVNWATLIAKLYEISHLNISNGINSTDEIDANVEFDVTREEIHAMKQLLQARIIHCEEDKKQGNGNFNIDTYIAQIGLMNQLRDWLSIEEEEMGSIYKN